LVHGFAENCDYYIEPAILYALNNFDVHMIDLTGFGYSGGVRMAKNSIPKFQRDIIDSFSFFNP